MSIGLFRATTHPEVASRNDGVRRTNDELFSQRERGVGVCFAGRDSERAHRRRGGCRGALQTQKLPLALGQLPADEKFHPQAAILGSLSKGHEGFSCCRRSSTPSASAKRATESQKSERQVTADAKHSKQYGTPWRARIQNGNWGPLLLEMEMCTAMNVLFVRNRVCTASAIDIRFFACTQVHEDEHSAYLQRKPNRET